MVLSHLARTSTAALPRHLRAGPEKLNNFWRILSVTIDPFFSSSPKNIVTEFYPLKFAVPFKGYRTDALLIVIAKMLYLNVVSLYSKKMTLNTE